MRTLLITAIIFLLVLPFAWASCDLTNTLREGGECTKNLDEPQELSAYDKSVWVSGKVRVHEKKIDAGFMEHKNIYYYNIKAFDINDSSYKRAVYKIEGRGYTPETIIGMIDKAFLKNSQNLPQVIHVKNLVEAVSSISKISGEDVVFYLMRNYPKLLEKEGFKEYLKNKFPETDIDSLLSYELIREQPPSDKIEDENTEVSDVVYENGDIRNITYTSTADNNGVVHNGIRALLDNGQSMRIETNEFDNYDINISKNATVEDGDLRASYIRIQPGSRYNFVGSSFDDFSVYNPSYTNTYKLYLRTKPAQDFSLDSCSQCGIVDFINLNATMKGRFEYEKPARDFPLFTDIIEADGNFKMLFSASATNITKLDPAALSIYSGDFRVLFDNPKGYKFIEKQTPYTIINVLPDLNFTNKTLSKSDGSFRLYSENSENYWNKWEDVRYG
ncbi:MAG: hypothetical protein ACOCZ6_03140 [Nanoarchaeota archaeon]